MVHFYIFPRKWGGVTTSESFEMALGADVQNLQNRYSTLKYVPSLSIPEAHLRLLAVLLCGPFRIARSQRLRALFVGMHLAWYTCVLCLHHPPPHP